MSIILYGLILASVFWIVSFTADSDRTVLSQLSTTLVVSPFVAFSLLYVIKFIVSDQHASEFLMGMGIIFAFASWVAAGVLAFIDMLLNTAARRDG
jgi:hypothetical protein